MHLEWSFLLVELLLNVPSEDVSSYGGGGCLSCHTCCDDGRCFFSYKEPAHLVAHYDKQVAIMTYSNTSPHGIVLALNNIDTIRVIFSWSNLEYIEVQIITQIYILGISSR